MTTEQKASKLCYLIAVILCVLALFGTAVGPNVALEAIGLIALGLLV